MGLSDDSMRLQLQQQPSLMCPCRGQPGAQTLSNGWRPSPAPASSGWAGQAERGRRGAGTFQMRRERRAADQYSGSAVDSSSSWSLMLSSSVRSSLRVLPAAAAASVECVHHRYHPRIAQALKVSVMHELHMARKGLWQGGTKAGAPTACGTEPNASLRHCCCSGASGGSGSPPAGRRSNAEA